MFGISGLKIGAFAVAAVAVTSVVFFGYRYFVDLQNKVDVLKFQNQALEIGLQQQTATTQAAVQRVKEFADAEIDLRQKIRSLEAADAENRRRVDVIRKKFSEHDLQSLAGSKPVLLERALTRASNRALVMLGCASGSKDPDCAPAGAPAPGPAPAPAGPGPDSGGQGRVEGPDP